MQALRLNLDGAMKTIDDLSQENSNLIQLEAQIHNLEKELAARPTIEQIAALEAQIEQLIQAGPTIDQMSTLEAAKAEARKEKAAPD